MSAARRSVPRKREVPPAHGVKLGLKAGIASGGLGAHRGHAVTVIVRTTLAELDQAAHAVTHPEVPMPGAAHTGGDSALPMREAIRMAADSIHYLAVFHEHTGRPIDLGRQARIATADQRIICYARDGGGTRPGCLTPGYYSEVHHSPDWSPEGAADADKLFFPCGPDHGLLTSGHYRAEVTDTGRLAWTDGTNHPTSTTPTTPKNSCTATPTHPTKTRSDIGVQRLSGLPVPGTAPGMPPAMYRPSAPKPVSVATSVTMPVTVTVPTGRLHHRSPRIRLGRAGVGDSRADAEGGRADDAGDRHGANQSLDIHRMTPSKSITNRED